MIGTGGDVVFLTVSSSGQIDTLMVGVGRMSRAESSNAQNRIFLSFEDDVVTVYEPKKDTLQSTHTHSNTDQRSYALGALEYERSSIDIFAETQPSCIMPSNREAKTECFKMVSEWNILKRNKHPITSMYTI